LSVALSAVAVAALGDHLIENIPSHS